MGHRFRRWSGCSAEKKTTEVKNESHFNFSKLLSILTIVWIVTVKKIFKLDYPEGKSADFFFVTGCAIISVLPFQLPLCAWVVWCLSWFSTGFMQSRLFSFFFCFFDNFSRMTQNFTMCPFGSNKCDQIIDFRHFFDDSL